MRTIESARPVRKAGYTMPTQEERLTTLEQTQAQSGESINDLNHHVTMLIGIVQRQAWDIREIKNSLRVIDGRLGSFDTRLGSFEQSVNSRFETQDKKLDQIMALLTTLTTKSDQET